MAGRNQVTPLQKVSKQLVNAAEKRAGLKAELAALGRAQKTARDDSKRKRLKQEIEQLSRKIEELIAEIAQPVPRRLERWTGVIPVTLRVESRGKKYEHLASTVDLSERGLRILTTTALTTGQVLEVYSNRARIGHCRVVWVAGAGSDRPGEVGLEILK